MEMAAKCALNLSQRIYSHSRSLSLRHTHTHAQKSRELFPERHSISTKTELMNYLWDNELIESPKVAQVMNTIDRALFVLKGSPPYIDSYLPNGFDSSIYPPREHAFALEWLQNHLKPGMRALDLGSGTGYLVACFGLMVGSNGRAVGVDYFPELVNFSVRNIEKSEAGPLLKEGSVSVHVGDGREGWGALAPYDAIHVGFIVPEIFPAYIEQLNTGGRLLIAVEEGASVSQLVVDKKSSGKIIVQELYKF